MKKDFLAVAIVAFLIAILCAGTKFQSVEDYYLTHLDDITPESETVFLSIECGTILDNWDDLDESLRFEKYVPSDGIILEQTEYVLRKDDTVYDILNRAVRHNKIQMEYQGANENAFGSVYIRGINFLYEFSCGPLSGWMYKVNGQFPNYGCSKYVLKDGDVIEWVYTCDLGRDVGGGWFYDEGV
ncbi:putative uncharacterized protein [Subdoligranulum sp. CAG:314]|jgi:hypothetical protein|nr:DUF4430 domain-containing protein [Subdoligranulum sp.]CDE71705.1 putative uncharacterized protein [Subdoligranulum sp. CAG:314]